jgi:predicted phosphodiesterase
MRYAFLGDIHANLAALDAVLDHIQRKSVDAVYHLGDVVGYGPAPLEVIQRLQAERIAGVRGEHDERVAGSTRSQVGDEQDDSVELAEEVCRWTREHLSPAALRWLGQLRFQRTIRDDGRTLALFHATPIQTTFPAHQRQRDGFFREMVEYTRADINVFGHTHVPFSRMVAGCWFVNVGSVGFSRDDDARPAYAIVDTRGRVEVRIHRVSYDVRRAAAAVRAAALPAGILRLLGTS